MNLVEIFLRVVITIAVMLLMARINGPKQIAQMSFYDYVSGITVGSIAATISINSSVSFFAGLFAIILFFGTSLLLNKATQVNLTANTILTGKPICLMEQGTINEKGLRKSKMTVSELLSNLHYCGYFNINDVYTVLLEPTGKLSVQPKEYARNVRKEDMHSVTIEPVQFYSVILDGVILHENLSKLKKDERWLYRELGKQNTDASELEDILLAVLDEQEKLTVYKKEC